MKTRIPFLLGCAYFAVACSTQLTETTQGIAQWEAKTDGKLTIEMLILGYSSANLEANIDEFCRLNPRYIQKTQLNEIDTSDQNSGWRFIKSSSSGIIYRYSFRIGDAIVLPINGLRSYAIEEREGG